MDRGEWEHVIREALRMEAWRTAAARRADMQGIEVGIQKEITTGLLEWGKLTPYEQALLRSILSGSIWTQDRLHRAKLALSPVCPYCSTGATEDHEHLWWKCPAWQDVRQMYAEACELDSEALPACMRCCGLLPVDYTIGLSSRRPRQKPTELEAEVEVIDLTRDSSEDGSTAPRTGQYRELTINGRIVVYTDGAARNNQHKLLRYSGCGAYWGPGHPFNVSAPIEGVEQTNNRAELAAVVTTLQIEVRPVEVRTDSKYVYDGVSQHRAKWRKNNWTIKGRKMRNADLWAQLDHILEARPVESVQITKIRGHTTTHDVFQGTVTLHDKEGNDAADALAVAGAFRNKWRDASQSLHAQLHTTAQVQRMMVSILQRRLKIQQAVAEEAEEEEEKSSSSSDSSRSHHSRSGSRSASSSRSESASSSWAPPWPD